MTIETESNEERELFEGITRDNNNRMISAHQDHVRRLMDELAIARVCIRELGDRLAKLEKPWVGLTNEELCEIVGLSTNDSDWNVFKVQEWLRKVEAKLKEKNT